MVPGIDNLLTGSLLFCSLTSAADSRVVVDIQQFALTTASSG